MGCGWLGLPLAIELSLKEYLIKGSTTSNDKLKTLKLNDIQPFIINLSNREPIYDQFLNSEILIIAIPSKNINDFQYLISKIETSKTADIKDLQVGKTQSIKLIALKYNFY